MKDKILITGAAGFIGSHLVELLLEENISPQSLRLLIPKGESLQNLPKANFKIIRGDIRNKSDVRQAMQRVNIIYHLAALTIDGGKYYSKTEYQEVNVKGTQNLLEVCRDKKIKKFILFSSIAVYGLPAWVGNIENWNEKRAKNPREIYGESKLQAEEEVIKAHKKWGIPYAIIRPTSVYGPRDKRNLLELYRVVKKHLFFYIGNGRNKMDYVFVKDVARAAYLAQKSRNKTGDYIIGCGIPISLNEVVSYIAKSINTSVPNLHIPKDIAILLSYIVKLVSVILGIKPILFPQRVKVLTTNCYFNIAKARKEIKYHPKFSFENGTCLTAKWLLASNIL